MMVTQERVSLLVDVEERMIGLVYSNFQESIVLFIIMKTKSLFDHITHITSKQTKNYWEDITDGIRKLGLITW